MMKKLLLIIVVLTAAYFSEIESRLLPAPQVDVITNSSSTDHLLAAAYENNQSNLQVQGSGRVIRILPDDNDGNRHQRLIIKLLSGQTLLLAHNIDLANRIASINIGDDIDFNGVYEWNAQGGVIHWTHHDPQGSHAAGWVRHNGNIYQ